MKDGINQCGGSGIESVDHFDGVGIVRIRPVVNKVEIKRAKRLIVEQIPHLADIEFPKRPVEDDGTLRPLFIGAFSKDGLIGAAFVTPGIQAAQSFLGYFSASAGAYQCAELVRRTVAEVEGIAVVDEYRRRGVALALKRYIDAWAADHGACLVLSVPTNEAGLVVAIQFPSPSRVSHLTAKYSSPDTPGEEATEGHCPALTDIPPGLAIGRNAQQLYPASCPRSKAKGREQGPPSAYTT